MGGELTAMLDGKVALVTGGSSGIGRAAAMACARHGAKVVIADLDPLGGAETLRLIAAAEGEVVFQQADVSVAGQVEAAVAKTVQTYGRLDCAFNNAGYVGSDASVLEYREEDWDRLMDVNLKGVWHCMRFEIRQMLKQGGGSIVNTASELGLVGSRLFAYSASKHGVIGLTRSVALEYAKAGIRVNAVCPGPTRTPPLERVIGGSATREQLMIARIPMGRLGSPEDIAAAVVWLCSDAASFVTGHALSVDGGLVAA